MFPYKVYRLYRLCIIIYICIYVNVYVSGAIAVVAVLIFVFGFAIGLGAVSWVVMAGKNFRRTFQEISNNILHQIEIMSTRLRSKAFGLFVSINWGFNLVIGVIYI